MKLHPMRYFDPNPEIRELASELYMSIKYLPIVSPHGHVEPHLLAENRPFPNPVKLIITRDHYLFTLLYSQGIKLESLGIPTQDGTSVETDNRKIWQTFADNYFLFSGTPTGAWLNYEFAEVFGIEEILNSKNGMKIYDQLIEKLKTPEYLPRALFERFKIEVLTTTDGTSDTLEYHKAIKESSWNGRVIPSFRPDSVVNITSENWLSEIKKLSDVSGIEINSYKNYIAAIENRRAFFKQMGAVATDQDVHNPYTHQLTESKADEIFQRALKGNATKEDSAKFFANFLMEMSRMSIEDGLVMQIHCGVYRNHNKPLFEKFGSDAGSDFPVKTEFVKNLKELLNKYGNDTRLKLIVFTLDESTYTRELAPMAGHYPALKLGPAWWFNDSIEGITRFREQMTETAGIYNTVGFNDDTRAFPSIPARHDLSRRIDANVLARLTARHIIDMDEAKKMIKVLTYGLVKESYNL